MDEVDILSIPLAVPEASVFSPVTIRANQTGSFLVTVGEAAEFLETHYFLLYWQFSTPNGVYEDGRVIKFYPKGASLYLTVDPPDIPGEREYSSSLFVTPIRRRNGYPVSLTLVNLALSRL